MSPETLPSFMALTLGFAIAGLIAAGFRLATDRPIGFSLLSATPKSRALAAVPLLVFAAPFVIMRNTVLGRKLENRHIAFCTLATMIAGFWSLMSGTVVVAVLKALGVV